MKNLLLGIDIGGTKCAVIYGYNDAEGIKIVDKQEFQTTNVNDTINSLLETTSATMQKHGLSSGNISAIGISCGGPLDSKKGIIMSPPNLPGWDNIPIVNLFEKRFGIKTAVQNDANACALAEWKRGAARGYNNVVFLTFGTGMGAGLILDGKLYAGTNDNAGEIGHVRLEKTGPVGYGKAGSFEGFCSGSGIAQLARIKVMEKLQMGESVSFCKNRDALQSITAKVVADAAREGDPLAREIYEESAYYLGKALSILIDVLNPEIIVIGSIYCRAQKLMEPVMNETIDYESIIQSRSVCKIVPAELGENIGDYAALSVALNAIV
ncbi:MAG: ROK family protein [Porphyromonadaceae bacterium]|nr:ROK family protein [Porphyromonadaceae bacterium]